MRDLAIVRARSPGSLGSTDRLPLHSPAPAASALPACGATPRALGLASCRASRSLPAPPSLEPTAMAAVHRRHVLPRRYLVLSRTVRAACMSTAAATATSSATRSATTPTPSTAMAASQQPHPHPVRQRRRDHWRGPRRRQHHRRGDGCTVVAAPAPSAATASSRPARSATMIIHDESPPPASVGTSSIENP